MDISKNRIVLAFQFQCYLYYIDSGILFFLSQKKKNLGLRQDPPYVRSGIPVPSLWRLKLPQRRRIFNKLLPYPNMSSVAPKLTF